MYVALCFCAVRFNSDIHSVLVGYISRSELLDALDKAQVGLDTPCLFTAPPANSDLDSYYDIRPWMDVSPIQVTPEAPLNSVFDLFKRLGLRCTPFTWHTVILRRNSRYFSLSVRTVDRHCHNEGSVASYRGARTTPKCECAKLKPS